MSRRWRPSLALVLGGALAGTLALSFAGLVALRYLGPEIGFRWAAVLLALGITALTAGLGWLLVRLLLRPIRALEAYARATEAGDPADPPAHFGTRELHATARRVIAMAEAQQGREASVRAYTDHVTHELKTPVAAIRAAVELMEDGGALSPDDSALLAQVDGARAQIEAQLSALRDAARARETRYLGTCTLADVAPGLGADWPDLTLASEGDRVPLPMAAEGLALVLSQLLRNAAEHGATRVSLSSEGPRLTVSDNGPGISDGNAARIFEPFFTTRRDQGGTGMGLAVTRAILAAHRGRIRHVPGRPGTTFEITFDPATP
ncbi:sensor histidine kinase [Mesobacterium pallidum]|uniref:sensor histidine kinase n=1 Tax=Mesobacterium pallidum TaxID=2872037 RepID=UPI001EE3175C|nr:HAMP domain-containing sensor histidine kinase [Mesobacterium pallidum]